MWLVSDKPDKGLGRVAGLAKAAKEALRQKSEKSKSAQPLAEEVSSLTARVSRVATACDNATGSKVEQSRQERTLEAHIGLLW